MREINNLQDLDSLKKDLPDGPSYATNKETDSSSPLEPATHHGDSTEPHEDFHMEPFLKRYQEANRGLVEMEIGVPNRPTRKSNIGLRTGSNVPTWTDVSGGVDAIKEHLLKESGYLE